MTRAEELPGSPAGSAPSPGAGKVGWVAATIALGAFTGQLDTSVVNIGLDTLARDLGQGHGGLAQTQWVTNGYLLALAVSLPATGWLTRRFGAAPVWLSALGGFTVASAGCALSPTLGWLICARIVQGLFAGLVVPAGLTILGRVVGPDRLGRVMASLGVVMTLAPTLGPTVGGALLRFAGWPWLFWVNLPIGAVAIALGLRVLPRSGPDRGEAGRLDSPGLLLLSGGVPALVYGATLLGDRDAAGQGPGVGWLAPACLVVGISGLAGFVLRARRIEQPLLNVRLYRVASYSAASAAGLFTSALVYGASLLFPLWFQIARHADPVQTGLLLISMSVGNIVALPLAGRLVDRFGGGVVCFWGSIGAVVTTLPFALTTTHLGGIGVQLLLLARGVAVATAMMPPNASAFRAVSAGDLPDATTAVNILNRVGGALGGAVLAVTLTNALDAEPAAQAFQRSFCWLAAMSVLGVLAAAWLLRAERHESTVT